MDLQTTAHKLTSPEFNWYDYKVLHLEPTTTCNLSCPQCDRHDPTDYSKTSKFFQKASMTLKLAEKTFSPDWIKNLKKMFMCGNFGDPAACKESLKIYRYFRKHNPNITLGMNTNGSLRSIAYWQELASIFNQTYDYVVFSIDGLEDTNHIYRINSNWNKLIENVKNFIDAGGIAHWDMLVFKHNEHQLEECIDLARELGFCWFRAKYTKRPIFEYLSDRLQQTDKFQPLQIINRPNSCPHDNEKTVYVDSFGKIWPCCHIASTYGSDSEEGKQLRQQFSTTNDISLYIKNTWHQSVLSPCITNCGLTEINDASRSQWRLELQLK